jgi:membrane protein DedA with SNARE-associated domain
MLSEYLELVSNYVSRYGYITILLGLMLENVLFLGLIFPGLFILIFGGYYAGLGNLNIFAVIISAFLGTVLGDNLSYALGYFGLVNLPILKRFSTELDKIERSIHANTERFLVLFHFPVYSRMILPAFLGVLKFNTRRWVVLDLIGAFLFSTTFATIGYVIGRSSRTLESAIDISNYIQWAFLLVFGWWLISAILTIRRLFKKNDTS